ncbi:hypothetical protein [Nonomuraea dietziae]|uniref:Uncharacterized protein n=1 Tax=Nonomuraea dietziae TaxID=65515 RepID=A0A7W5V8U6_9ACTN|nr:hypothetical protein [Nonomuraea dietziae]MBB3727140.1 hypothetical protein [Nonomuraea dietziae]
MYDIAAFAASIAPVIDAVHIDVHAVGRQAGVEYVRRSGLRPGFLIDQRYVLPLRPLTRAGLAAVYRYGTAAERDAEVADHLSQGTLREDGHGGLHATPVTLAFVEGLYTLHEQATAKLWSGREELVGEVGELVGRLLETAERVRGGALEAMAPPYEPEGVSAGVALFNRLAAFRYHRADAHAAALAGGGAVRAGDLPAARGAGVGEGRAGDQPAGGRAVRAAGSGRQAAADGRTSHAVEVLSRP